MNLGTVSFLLEYVLKEDYHYRNGASVLEPVMPDSDGLSKIDVNPVA